jgi:hypothetical protein
MSNPADFSTGPHSSLAPDEPKSDPVCALLQQIGLPAVRIASGTAQVISFNELFSSLINRSDLPDYRVWLVEGIVRHFTAGDKIRWKAALARPTPLQIHVPLALSDGRTLHSVMRLVPSIGIQETSDQSIFCIFILLTGPYFDQLRESLIAEGKQSERNRLRDALHAEIGQQLLGAAFGCETIADKIANLDQDLGREASHLADLLSRATQALHAVVNPSDEVA